MPPIAHLPAPPLPPEPDMLFVEQPDLVVISQQLAASGQEASNLQRFGRPRIGRGGRLIFDRLELAPVL